MADNGVTLKLIAEVVVGLEIKAKDKLYLMAILADNKDVLTGKLKGNERWEILLQGTDKRVFEKCIALMKQNILIGVSQLGPFIGTAFLDATKFDSDTKGVALDINVTQLTDTASALTEIEAAVMRFDIDKRKLPEHM